jgi:hypothetical protein
VIIKYEDVEAYVAARDDVIKAAIKVVERYNTDPTGPPAEELALDSEVMEDLVAAVEALHSLNADRGVRDPSTPGEQASGQEQAHGEDRDDREQP